MLMWRSGSVRALNASGPGFDSTQGNMFFFFYFFLIFYFSVIFLSNYYYITEFTKQYIAGFKLFSVSECLHSSTENVFHIYQEHRKSFGQKIVRIEGCAFNKIQLHRSFTVFE